MPNPVHAYISDIYDLVFVGFYGISTIVGNLMPNHINTFISNIYVYLPTPTYGLDVT